MASANGRIGYGSLRPGFLVNVHRSSYRRVFEKLMELSRESVLQIYEGRKRHGSGHWTMEQEAAGMLLGKCGPKYYKNLVSYYDMREVEDSQESHSTPYSPSGIEVQESVNFDQRQCTQIKEALCKFVEDLKSCLDQLLDSLSRINSVSS